MFDGIQNFIRLLMWIAVFAIFVGVPCFVYVLVKVGMWLYQHISFQ